VTAVSFRGRDVALFHEAAQEAAAELDEVAGGVAEGALALSFANVSVLGAAMLAKLALLHKRLQAGRARLILCDLQPQVYEAFQVTRLDTVLDIRPRESLRRLAAG
jgi:anti-anti-sigma factor